MAMRPQTPIHKGQHGLALISFLLFITIIIITAVHLDSTKVIGTSPTGGEITERYCYLGDGAVSLCNWAYVVCAVAMLLLICISAIQCTASKAFRLGVPSAAWGDVILGMILTIWIALSVGIISVGFGKAEGANPAVPESNWRTAVLVILWINFLLALCMILVGAARNGMKSLVATPAQQAAVALPPTTKAEAKAEAAAAAAKAAPAAATAV